MANVDIRQGGHAANAKVAGIPMKVMRLSRTYDCKVTNVTSGDVLQMIHIPAGMTILGCALYCHRAEGAAQTVDVGPYTHSSDAAIDADGFFNDADLNVAGVKLGATNGVLTFPYESATDVAMDISVLFNNTADNARFTLTVLVADMSDTLVDNITNASV